MLDKALKQWPGLSDEMAERIRAHDWGKTPLGSIEDWPKRLVTVVDLLLCSRRANYILYGPSLTLIYNDVYIPNLGSKHPNALGRPYQEVWPETWVQSEPLLMAAMQGKAQYFVDCPFNFPDDAEQPIRWFTFQWTPLRDDEGVVRGIYASAAETTKQVLAQERLRESEERLRFITECAGIGCWHWDAEPDRHEWSPLFRKLLGIPADTPPSFKRFLDAVHPESRAEVENANRAALANGGNYETEYRIVLPNGPERWIYAKGGLADPNRPRCMAGIVLDVTARKEAEEALRRSEHRYRGLVEQMTDGLFVIDPNLTIIDVNRAGCTMLGMTRSELIGINARDVTSSKDRDRIGSKIELYEDDGVHLSEWRFKRKNGVEFIGEIAGRKLPSGNLQAVVRDITERKRQEAEIQLLVREVNHRSKNILAVVQAVARQTAASNPDEFVERFGERIQALAASHDLLVKSKWMGVELAELVHSQLAHFKDLIGTRIILKGPEAVLTATAAQALGMTIHELSANASKYGALSNAEGCVRVEWYLRPSPGQKKDFEMFWREEGGPHVTMPSRRGFGSSVISEMAEMTLNAEVDLEFPASGLYWRLRCAAADVLAERL